MHYCISDVHGESERYRQLLRKIQFSDDDTLFVLGDVIDRGGHGLDILVDIMSRPNVKMIVGNHEVMMMDAMLFGYLEMYRKRWAKNGGSKTRRRLKYFFSPAERERILRFCMDLPDHLDVTVADRQFHLVHGMVAKKTEARVWDRPDKDTSNPISGKTVVVGHTPVPYLTSFDKSEPFHIWHGDGIIGIDCGCGNKTPRRRLACLRLEDMAEFYV